MKPANPVEAINQLMKGVQIAYSRKAYSMAEVRDIYESIEFLVELIKAAQPAEPAESTTSAAEPKE